MKIIEFENINGAKVYFNESAIHQIFPVLKSGKIVEVRIYMSDGQFTRVTVKEAQRLFKIKF